MPEAILATPLHSAHVKAGGRMVPFAGYEMPVQYASVIAEAKAVRDGVGMFDVSHMARLRFTGDRVLEYLEQITANDIAKLEDRRGQYSLLPNKKGGCVDDIIVYRMTESEFRMVVNASNHEKDVAWMRAENAFDVTIEDMSDESAMIAVQGPNAVETIARMSTKPDDIRSVPMFGVVECEIAGVSCFAPRTGYTGEDGYELICAEGDADKLWYSLLAEGVAPCGLAARDILRVEAGLPLYGHELEEDINPIATGLGWVISKSKNFNSSTFFSEAREKGTPTKLQGIRLESKRVASPDMPVFVGGKEVGKVSSGVYSPLLDAGIAFAWIDSSIPLETSCEIEIRGKREAGTVVNKRFFKRTK